MTGYHEILSVLGPLYVPSSSSGVHTPTCDHQAPRSCPRCDGDFEEVQEYWRATPEERRLYRRQFRMINGGGSS